MSTWGDKLQKLTREALNRLAAVEFAKDRVYAICAERAGQGFSWAEIRPSVAVNMQECDAVKGLLAALSKEKLRYEWIPMQENPDLKYSVLQINWDVKR